MKRLGLSLVLVLAGCCSTHPGSGYVEADRQTYDFAAPKLKQWADKKKEEGDPDWEGIVKNKLISWDARISKRESKEESSE